MGEAKQPARTYNQDHIARKYTRGKRRLSIYWRWSYPWESQRDLTEMENRFSTMTEVRRVAWPNYEAPEWGDRAVPSGYCRYFGTVSPLGVEFSADRG